MNYAANGFAPDFRAAGGFVRRTDIVNANLAHRFVNFGRAGSRVETFSTDASLFLTWRYHNLFSGAVSRTTSSSTSRDVGIPRRLAIDVGAYLESFQYDPGLYANYYLERTLAGGVIDTVVSAGHRIENLDFSFNLQTPQFEKFNGGINVIGGADENFFEWSQAYIGLITATADWRPTNKLRVGFRYPLQLYLRASDRTLVSQRHIPRLKVEYRWPARFS